MTMPSLDALRASAARYRLHSEAIGLGLLIAVVALALGSAARRRTTPLRLESARLHAMTSELASFRASFRPASDVEGARLPDSLDVAIPRAARVTLAERVASRAEQLGLAHVRVRFVPADSGATTTAPELVSSSPAVADYALTIDCEGGFAAVLSLVNHLPPSVALQHLSATSATNVANGSTRYHLTLAVFETTESDRHG